MILIRPEQVLVDSDLIVEAPIITLEDLDNRLWKMEDQMSRLSHVMVKRDYEND